MREWDPQWRDIMEPPHAAKVRRMVVAAINWIEQWPASYPEWQERPILNAQKSMDWAAVYLPTNDHARQWFTAITSVCDERPSASMMRNAIECGCLLRNNGWEVFDRLMRTGGWQG